MHAPVTVACLGECMIELREQSPGVLVQGYAGDTYNVAVYLKRLDARGALDVHYATALGGDAFADDMLAAWAAEGIGTALVRRVPERSTGLYAIRTDASGERHFSYWRDTSAARAYFDAAVTPLEQRADAIDLLVLSGITLAVMRAALDVRLPALLDRVRARGGRVAFDNNYRPRLWPDRGAARSAFAAILARTDIALLTLDDALAVEPSSDVEHVLAQAFALPCAEVVVKRGTASTLVRGVDDARWIEAPVQAVKHPVDTTAAGDSFDAGYLVRRLSGDPPRTAAAFGNRVASVVVRHAGAIVPRAALASLTDVGTREATR
ncbi:MAG TPA: sugar kinase [Caldimonas sp.]|nr:sugar kinase [Caldimonas sp.]